MQWAFLKYLKGPQTQTSSGWPPCAPCLLLTVALVAASLSSQHTFSQAPPSPAPSASNLRSLCSAYLSGERQKLTLAYTKKCSQEAQNQHTWWPLQTTPDHQQMSHPKGGLRRIQSLTKANPTPWGETPHYSSSTVTTARFHNQSV